MIDNRVGAIYSILVSDSRLVGLIAAGCTVRGVSPSGCPHHPPSMSSPKAEDGNHFLGESRVVRVLPCVPASLCAATSPPSATMRHAMRLVASQSSEYESARAGEPCETDT